MLPKKIKTVTTAFDLTRFRETKKSTLDIGSLFTVAVAVRKFQKYQSEKYKKLLSYDFNRQEALSELKSLYVTDKLFYAKFFIRLSYLVQKFNFTFNDLSSLDYDGEPPLVHQIFEFIEKCLRSDEPFDQKMVEFLCSTLKIITQNSTCEDLPLNIFSVINLCNNCKISLARNELISLLMYFFIKLNADHKTDSELLSAILTLSDMTDEAKSFFLKLELNENAKISSSLASNMRANSSLAVPKVKKNQQVVSKTIQTVKAKQNSQDSEEENFKMLNLAGRLQNKKRRTNVTSTIDDGTDPQESSDGDDRSWYNSTWPEVLNLYTIVKGGDILKEDDKNNYIPDKFFGKHYYFWSITPSAKKVYSFFINKMCVSILLNVSKKQCFNAKTLNKLMKCITNFDNLRSELDLKEDFVKVFTDAILDQYWKFKELTDPDVAVDFLRNVMHKTIEEYTVGYWPAQWNSARLKKFNHGEIYDFLVKEINSVRVDAIKALYNCAVKNKKQVLTKERLEKIRVFSRKPETDQKQKANKTFTDHIFKLIELAETLENFDYKKFFEDYHNRLQDPKSLEEIEIKSILRFMNNQVRDSNRAAELVHSREISTFIRLLQSDSGLTSSQRELVLNTINTYLHHENSSSLSDENYEDLLEIALLNANTGSIKSYLTSCLLTTDKTQRMLNEGHNLSPITNNCMKKLIELYNSLIDSEEITSFIVFILSRVFCAENSKSTVLFLEDQKIVDLISVKLSSSHSIKFDDECDADDMIQINNCAKAKDSCNKICFLAAKMILRSVDNKVPLTSSTLDNLILILSSEYGDKQTNIIVAKCLYGVTKYMSFHDTDNLCQLLDLVDSTTYDVSIYIRTAYIRGCLKVAFAPLPVKLDSIHMESMSSMFIYDESLTLGHVDYKDEINETILKVLLYEARKQDFHDNLFLLFEFILNMNERYTLQVLAILLAYSYNFVIPESTVKSLENLLGVSSCFESALMVLENVIMVTKAPVNTKTLSVFADYLKQSHNSRLRFYSFKLLEQARHNQQLPDIIFSLCELVRAGYAIEQLHTKEEQEPILEYVQKSAEKGVKLPIDTKIALAKEIGDLKVLKIFETVTRNKEIIHSKLLITLFEMFDPSNIDKRETNLLLLKIYENAAQNNQPLRESLFVKLESALDVEELKKGVLPVFMYLAQKGEKLPTKVNNELLDCLIKLDYPTLKQGLLSSLGSILVANKSDIQFYLPKIDQILLEEINSDHLNIQKLCLGTVSCLVRVSKHISDRLLTKLVEIGTNTDTNKTIKLSIYELFQTVITDDCNSLICQEGLRGKIELSNLTFSSVEDLLDQLKYYNELKGGFPPATYRQLKELMDYGSFEQQTNILNVLHACSCTNSIPDEFLETVAMLYEITMSEELKDSCVRLIINANESGKLLKGKVLEIMESKVHRHKNLEIFLRGSCASTIKEEFGLSRSTLSNILELVNESGKLNNVKELADLLLLIIEENFTYPTNESFVNLIEQCMSNARILDLTIPIYCRLIKEGQVCDSKFKCIEILVIYFIKYEQELNHLLPVMCECMYHAVKFNELPIICSSFAVSNLTNENHLVRGYSFGILRSTTGNNSSSISKDWFKDLVHNLNEDIRSIIEHSEDSLALLETVVSVDYLDSEVFSKNKTKEWKRELLISDLFKYYQVLQLDQIQFYKIWFEIERKFDYHQSFELLSLIQKCNFMDSFQLMNLLIMIFNLQFSVAKHILTIHSPNPYFPLKEVWCSGILNNCLTTGINETYSRKLIGRLCSNFDIFFLSKLFSCLKSIDNLYVFEDIMKFCLSNDINIKMIPESKNLPLDTLKHVIESNFLCKCAHRQSMYDSQTQDFIQVYLALKRAGWKYDQLHNIVSNFNPIKNDFKNLLFLLNTLESYQLPPSNFEEIMNILIEFKSFEKIIQNTNNLIIENHFQQEGKIKDFTEILMELKESNQSYEYLVDLIDSSSLNIKENIFKQQSKLLIWNEKQIKLWAQDIKHNKKEFCDYEAIAIILRANFLITGHTLTDTQILCCLIALKKRQCKGKLLEVATGEGKSTIICILAIITALRGKKVDVITSSPVLAERDSKQKAQLYRMFSLTCSDNNDKTVYLRGKKKCYLDDIVYGEMSQFQFDILRDNYSKLDTLAGRTFSTAIVDEVDSMLIDDSSKIARLSSSVPGMDHFHVIYVFIWQHLQTLMQRFIMFKNKMHYLKDGEVGFENGKITLELDGGDGQPVKITDLDQYITISGDQNQVSVAVDDIDKFLRKELETYIEHQIKNNQIYIPSNFSDLLEKQKSKWISNAVEALNYQENIHYIVQNGQIKPVDYHSTGVVQSSTVWSDGLHQFLQLKHNLKITSETLTTNFLSNLGFMETYETVYGLTGTLGSKTARKVLKNVYKVDVINIPQRRQKQFLELNNAIIKENEREWLQEIVSCIKLEIMKKRGILVICETIGTANRIDELLKTKLHSSSVKLYTMNDMDQEKNVDNISPGQVIIATNLAGRGTDIRTEEIEETGGLHVVLTFLPNNQRVEDQAYGRTARQGKRGSGVMILNSQTLNGFESKKNVKEERDNLEINQLNYFIEKELELIKIKDKLFDKFCEFLNDDIRLPIRKENDSYARQALSELIYLLPTTYETCVLSAVEEIWANFLSKIDEGIITCADAEISCDDLLKDLKSEFKKKKIIKNPYYLISIGNDILKKSPKKAKEALGYFQEAVLLEQNRILSNEEADKNIFCPGAAHVGISWCRILIENEDCKQHAYESFQSAFNCLSNEMTILNTMQLLLKQKQTAFANSELDNQLKIKANILGSYIQGVKSNIDALKRSKRMINLVSIDSNDSEALEKKEYFKDLERSDDKKAFKNNNMQLAENKSYYLVLNNLTAHQDLITKDQALKTLNNISLSKISFKSNQKNLKINLNQVDLGRVHETLLSSDKEFTDLTRDTAISKLKEERSYFNAFHITDSYLTDLRITSTDIMKMNETYKDKQINELIDVIDKTDVNDKNIRFDILIHKANENEIANHFSHSDLSPKTIINMIFSNMNKDIAKKKLSAVKASSFDIELVLPKSSLLEVISKTHFLISGTINSTKSQIFEKLERKKLMNRVSKLRNDVPYFMKFDKLDKSQTLSIVESCPGTVVLKICFRDVDHSASELWEGQVDFSFDNMDKETADKFITVLRMHHFEFSLEFKELKKNEVKNILMKAELGQEKMKIMKVKNVRDLFMQHSFPELELKEFSLKGMEYILEINEKLFIPIRSICLVSTLGVGQVLLGGVLIASGFGASTGMGLVTEGIADTFVAYRAIRSRQFSWNDYCVQKAVSLAISAVSMGWSSMKEGAKGAAKGLETVAAGAGKEVLEQAGTKVITDGKAVGLIMKTTGKNLRGLSMKFIGVKATEAVAREVINTGISQLSDFAFDSMMPNISESIQTNVRNSFTRCELLLYLYKMRTVDLVTESSQLDGRINKIVADIINPRNDFMTKHWNSIALPLIKGVLSDSSRYGSTISKAIRVFGTLSGMKEVITLTDKVVQTLLEKLRLIDRNTFPIHLILFTHLRINKTRSKLITKKLKNLGIINDQDNFCDESNAAEKLAEFSRSFKESHESMVKEFDVDPDQQDYFIKDIEKSIEFLSKCNNEFIKLDLDSFNMMMKSISDQIAEQLVRVMDSQLLQPWSTLAVSGLTDALSQNIQHNYLVDKNQNSDSHVADQKKYDELSNKNKNDMTFEESQFVANYGKYRTFAQQINYNKNDYCLAYSQCEMIYYANNSSNESNKTNHKAVTKESNSVRDGDPADCGTMMATANSYGVELKIVDDKNYVKTEEDRANNVEIVYVEHASDNQIGHAYYMDSDGKFVDAKTTGTDCFYGAFSTILENRGIQKSIDDIRSDTADYIESNSGNFSKVLAVKEYIRNNYSNSENKFLFSAGLHYDKETDKMVLDKDDLEDMMDSVNKSNDKKHKRGGFSKKEFKKMLPKNDVENEEQTKDLNETAHHIIPGNVIITYMKEKFSANAINTNRDDLNILVTEFINQKHIKEPLKRCMDINVKTKSKYSGLLLHSSFYNNPHNLMFGPKPDKRSDDLGPGLDKPILNQQTQSYRNNVNNFMELKDFKSFTNLEEPNKVKWEKDDEGKYKVKE